MNSFFIFALIIYTAHSFSILVSFDRNLTWSSFDLQLRYDMQFLKFIWNMCKIKLDFWLRSSIHYNCSSHLFSIKPFTHRLKTKRCKFRTLLIRPDVFHLICILCHNFWTNYDLDLLSTSKWWSESQFCERYLWKWQKIS